MGAACTLTFTSCYGMPPNYDPSSEIPPYDPSWEFPDAYGMPPNYKSISGYVYEDLNANGKFDSGEEIEDIGIYFSDNEIGMSNDDGSYSAGFSSDEDKVPLVFKDAFDGTDPAAKKYKTRTVDFDFSESDDIEQNVAMEPEDNTPENQ